VGKQDPSGKTYAARFDNDARFFVKSFAKRIEEGKSCPFSDLRAIVGWDPRRLRGEDHAF
jgi:hypothetical protein